MTSYFRYKETLAETDDMLHRYILSLGQDLTYMKSRGKSRMPKHVGLSVALHQMTQSKDVVTMVNKLGHGISYDEVQRIDTCWSNIQASSVNPSLPQNMAYGRTTRGAGDNFNRATESLEGKHHDVVTWFCTKQTRDLTTRGLAPLVMFSQ
jgi:hypothetical protein